MSTPIYYFIFQDSLITIDGKMIIARPEGNVIVKYSKEVNSLICFIDKNVKTANVPKNRTKVTVNGVELVEDSIQLKVGDLLTVGSENYKLYDDFLEAEKMVPKHNRRKYRRPKNAYALSNFVNFYCAPPWALCLYFLVLLYTLSRYLPSFYLQAPKEIEFLEIKYNESVLPNLLLAVGLWWALSLGHSFLMYLYFNRNATRKSFIASAYTVVALFLLYSISLPLIRIRSYVEKRENILLLKESAPDKTINHLKRLTEDKVVLTDSFNRLRPEFSDSDAEVLTKDFEATMKRIDLEVKNHLDIATKETK